MIHVFFEGKDMAKDFMERVSLSGVYKTVQMVESSEWSVNFLNQPKRDYFGDVSHLCRTVDIPPYLPYDRTSESEATKKNKRKRQVLADDPDLIDGPKRYRKKRRKSTKHTKKKEERPEEEKDVLARVMSQTKGLHARVTAMTKVPDPIQLAPTQTKQTNLANCIRMEDITCMLTD